MKGIRKVISLVALSLVVAASSMISMVGCSKSSSVIKIAMLPKFKGENYFDAAKTGAEAAVSELNKTGKVVQFYYDGPPQDQATNQQQVNILEGWIAQKMNVILLSADDPTAIAPTLKKAQKQGIKVLTFDGDAQADARSLFVSQVTPEGVAEGLLKSAADQLKTKGYGPTNPANIALVSSARTDANQQSWVKAINKLLAQADYSWMKIKKPDVDIYYPGPDETETENESGTLIGRMGAGPDKIQAAIGLTSMATPALGAQYSSSSAKPDASKVVITGLATPAALKSYIKDDSNPLKTGVLWNVQNLGYLSVQCGYQMAKGTITSSSDSITAGKLGKLPISDKIVVLGPALVFDKSTVDNYNY